MSKVKQLIRLWAQGREKRYIGRALGMSKNTVKDYLFKLEQGGCGKSFLASALGHQACLQGYKVAYFNL